MKKRFIVLLAILFLIAIPVTKGNTPNPETLTQWVEERDEWEQTSEVLESWIISRDVWEQKKDSVVVQKHKKHKKENRRHRK